MAINASCVNLKSVTAPGGVTFDTDAIAQTVLCIQNTVSDVINSSQTALIGEGQDLAGGLLLITVSLSVLFWMISGDGAKAMVEALGTALRYFLVALLLAGWGPVVGDFFGDNIDQVTKKLAAAASPEEAVNSMVKAIGALLAGGAGPEQSCREESGIDISSGQPYTNTICTSVIPGQAGRTDAQDAAAKAPSWFGLLGPTAMLKFIYGILMKAFALVMLGLMLAAYLLAIIMSKVLFGLGMAVGPILVPWLIWERSQWLFDGWLRFMVIAAMTKMVATFMVLCVAGSIIAVRGLSALVDGPQVDLLAAHLLAIMAAVGAFMMWQVQSIAQSLVSGGAGVTSKQFGRGTAGGQLLGAIKGAIK